MGFVRRDEESRTRAKKRKRPSLKRLRRTKLKPLRKRSVRDCTSINWIWPGERKSANGIRAKKQRSVTIRKVYSFGFLPLTKPQSVF